MTDSTTDPYENMALDEALLLTCNKGLSPPTIRFYTWDPPALSIGYSQNLMQEVDTDLCNRINLPIVRRITGGMALLHDREDLTYTVVSQGDGPLKGASLSRSYRMINLCLVDALRKKGIDARLRVRKRDHNFSWPGLLGKESPFCFHIPAGSDIIISGKKVVGSAQRRLKSAFVQHGSILINPPRDFLIRVFKGLNNTSLMGFTWLTRHLSEKVDLCDLQESIQKSLEKGIGMRLIKGGLTRPEIELKDSLLKEKYLKDEWNLYRLASLNC